MWNRQQIVARGMRHGFRRRRSLLPLETVDSPRNLVERTREVGSWSYVEIGPRI